MTRSKLATLALLLVMLPLGILIYRDIGRSEKLHHEQKHVGLPVEAGNTRHQKSNDNQMQISDGNNGNDRQHDTVELVNEQTRPESLNNHGKCHQELKKSDNWFPPSLPEQLQHVEQDDPQLASHICQNWLLPPSTAPRKLSQPDRTHYSQRGQSEFIDNLLKHRKNGFFIESGAADGEGLSNSLFFEKSRNWTGLLVEANPSFFQSILKKHRHAYMMNACLSPTNKPLLIPFRLASYIGGLLNYMEEGHKKYINKKTKKDPEIIDVQCFPLFSILRAIGISHVDYFSLDIEGAELEVLKTLPLNNITVDVFGIEYKVLNDSKETRKKLNAIMDYLVVAHGYTAVKIKHGDEDIILVRNSLR